MCFKVRGGGGGVLNVGAEKMVNSQVQEYVCSVSGLDTYTKSAPKNTFAKSRSLFQIACTPEHLYHLAYLYTTPPTYHTTPRCTIFHCPHAVFTCSSL